MSAGSVIVWVNSQTYSLEYFEPSKRTVAVIVAVSTVESHFSHNSQFSQFFCCGI